MRTSSRGVKLIAKDEGLRLRAYKPVAGEPGWTIGYGHHGPDVKQGQVITRARARTLLRKDLAWAEDTVRRVDHALKLTFNQNEFDALVSLVFNCGPGAIERGSTIYRHLEGGRRRDAANTFLLWNKGGVPLAPIKGLTDRRRAERDLFLKPMSRRRKRKAAKLNATVTFDGVPVFRGHALVLGEARKRGWTGELTSGDRREGVPERYGKLSQAKLYAAWVAYSTRGVIPSFMHGQRPNPANPPGRGTHELRSDGVAYRGPVGRPLAWHQLGLDATKADELRATLNRLSFKARRPYVDPREQHHSNLYRNPARRLRKLGLA